MHKFKNCFYKMVCVDGHNHPKHCIECESYIKLTKKNENLPWSTQYWELKDLERIKKL